MAREEGVQAEEDPEQQHREGLEERVHKQSQQDDAPSLDCGPEQPSSSKASKLQAKGRRSPTRQYAHLYHPRAAVRKASSHQHLSEASPAHLLPALAPSWEQPPKKLLACFYASTSCLPALGKKSPMHWPLLPEWRVAGKAGVNVWCLRGLD